MVKMVPWYRATVAPVRWILMDLLIQVDPTAVCNDNTIPPLHRIRTPQKYPKKDQNREQAYLQNVFVNESWQCRQFVAGNIKLNLESISRFRKQEVNPALIANPFESSIAYRLRQAHDRASNHH